MQTPSNPTIYVKSDTRQNIVVKTSIVNGNTYLNVDQPTLAKNKST